MSKVQPNKTRLFWINKIQVIVMQQIAINISDILLLLYLASTGLWDFKNGTPEMLNIISSIPKETFATLI